MKSHIPILCLVAVTVSMLPASIDSPPSPPGSAHSVTYRTRSMGTTARIVLVTPDSVKSFPDAAAVRATFQRVDSLMSNWTETSEVARINRTAGRQSTTVHPEVAHVVEASIRYWKDSTGAFDITVEPLVRLWGFLGGKPHVPPDSAARIAFRTVGSQHLIFDPAARTIRFDVEGVKIDLGGIAKGYAADAAADSLKARGVVDALVDMSGNMRALGHPVGSEAWRIGIRDPRDRVPYFARLNLFSGEGIATSGQYEQFVAANGRTYGHIMDPRVGRPAEGLIGVTAICPNAMHADAWGKALFVLGPVDGKRMALARPEVSAVLIQPGRGGRDTVWVEKALADRFVLEPKADSLFHVEIF